MLSCCILIALQLHRIGVYRINAISQCPPETELNHHVRAAFFCYRLESLRFPKVIALAIVVLLLTRQIFFSVGTQLETGLGVKHALSDEQAIAPTFQPAFPIYATFFYPWYRNGVLDGKWSNWRGNGHTPPNNWFSNFLPLPPGSYDAATGAIHPTVGLYSSLDKDVLYWQLSQMEAAHLEVGISSWWGQATSPTNDSPGSYAVQGRSDVSFRQIITNWMNLADNPYPNMRWAIYYEKESLGDPSIAEIVSDLSYINSNYVNQQAYLKIERRPVLFVYADAADRCSMATRWQQAITQSGIDFYLVLKLFPGYAVCTAQPDSWHQYAPAVRFAAQVPYSAFVSPGFWKEGESVRLPRDTSAFEAAVETLVNTDTEWKLVETWNEWGEGTSVEPGIQVQQTINGEAVVASSGVPFEDRFIQTLARQIPALPMGTGARSQSSRLAGH